MWLGCTICDKGLELPDDEKGAITLHAICDDCEGTPRGQALIARWRAAKWPIKEVPNAQVP